MVIFLEMLETETDREVFRKLYEENKQMLFYIANQILKNETDAEDAVQTCFLKMAENFEKYKLQPYENLVRLCCTTVRNAATDIARERKKFKSIDDGNISWEDTIPDKSADILEQLIEKSDQLLVIKAVMQLSAEEREYMYLKYVMNIKPKDIGELLDKESTFIRKKLFLCRKKLADILDNKEYECLRG